MSVLQISTLDLQEKKGSGSQNFTCGITERHPLEAALKLGACKADSQAQPGQSQPSAVGHPRLSLCLGELFSLFIIQ